MTDLELNESVARKLGWVFDPEGSDDPKAFPWIQPHKSRQTYLPDFCRSIEAAWEIVEQVFTSFYLSWDETTETWFAKWDNQHRTEESCRYRAEADTAPMAICRAFLKLP